jgi:hypothetical protein
MDHRCASFQKERKRRSGVSSSSSSFYQPFHHSFIVISQFNRTKSEYTRVMESIRLSLVLIYRISIKFYYSGCVSCEL